MLRRKNWIINRKTVQRYMREMGIEGITPGLNVSRRNQQQRSILIFCEG
ncbi:hypothetical protein CULT_2320008 [[Clostridium] ultunense Esp]|nr:hypothetical protein CULT_2320008 [[Clostridium] ultunense Esp]